MKGRYNPLLTITFVCSVLTTAPAAERAALNGEVKTTINTQAVTRETLSLSFAPVFKKVAPSVVTITSTKTVKEQMMRNPLFQDPFFRRFFDFEDEEEGGGEQPRRRPRSRQEESLGSGVIVSADGYIISNSHVVEGADEIKVVLSDQREYSAEVVGTDPPTDISVLKIKGTNLPAMTMTDSDQLQVGDVVLAVGNPFGVGQTLTMGIVSAVGRGGFGIVDYEDFIQTDASINPGNSGGALVDSNGRLVGVPTAILSRTGGNLGIGFAVPINMARAVMNRISTEGRVVRGYLGVYVQPLDPDLQKAFDLPERTGALIGGVLPRSPAAEAGIQEGDVIVEMNGKKVTEARQLRLMIAQTAPDTKITFKLLRDGKERTVAARLDELKTEQMAQAGERPTPTGRKPETSLGMQVGDLDSRVRRQFEVPGEVSGAMVMSVDPDSAAASAGIRPGDVILEANRQKVDDAAEFAALTRKLKGNVLLRVWSGGGSRYVVIEPEAEEEKPTKPRR